VSFADNSVLCSLFLGLVVVVVVVVIVVVAVVYDVVALLLAK